METFRLFLEYAYSGTYTNPPPGHLASEESTSKPKGVEESTKKDNVVYTPLTSSTDSSPSSNSGTPHQEALFIDQRKCDLQKSFRLRKYPIGPVEAPRSSAPKTEHSRGSFMDMSPVLLAHAKLYVFGEKQTVPRLKELTLQKTSRNTERLSSNCEQIA